MILKERIKNGFRGQLITSLIYLALGIWLVMFPEDSVNIISKVVFGVVLMLIGLYHIWFYMSEDEGANVFNLFTGVIFYLLSGFFSNYDVIFTEIANVNLVLGFFNLIPFYSFDGGNTLKYILLKYVNEEITERTLTVVSLLVTVTFSFISIHIFLNYKHNFSLIIMSIYMFLSIIFKKENSLDY